MKLVTLVWLACAACSGLDTLDTTCGNGVVEIGEDCDSGSNCRQCSIVCDDDGKCPTGYACGADQLCHAPGGRFRGESASFAFAELGFGVTDVNGDHYPDVLALGGTSLTTFSGNAAGTLTDQATQITPSLQGNPAVTKLDPGDSLDIILPTNDGLLAYTSPAHVPSPYPFPVEVSAPDRPRALYVFPLDAQFLGLLVDDRMGHLGISIVNGNVKASNVTTAIGAVTPVCAGFSPTALVPTDRDDYATATTHLVVLTSSDGICEIEVTDEGTQAIVSHTVTGVTAAAGTHAWFARLEAVAQCPSILVETAVTATDVMVSEAVATGGPGTCKTTTVSAFPSFPGAPIGHVPIDAGPDAIATAFGIFTVGASPAQLYQSVRPLTSITTVDINGDGLTDVIASADGFDDLDVLVRYGSGSGAGFLPQSIDTVGIPRNVVAGDFDGDGVGDVTYSEKLAAVGGVPTERLMVVFGGHDAIQPPRFVATFHNIIETAYVNLKTTSDPNGDRVLDLIVLDHPDAQAETLLLTILYGDPQRTLLPFFDPRDASEIPFSQGFRDVVAGTFHTTTNNYRDLFTVEVTAGTTAGETRTYLMEPDANGAMSVTGVGDTVDLTTCHGGAHTGFCVDGSAMTTFRLSADASRDLVIGVDRDAANDVVLFDPGTLAQTPPALPVLAVSLTKLGLVTDPAVSPHRLYVADIDGDGANELVVGYGPNSDANIGTLVRCNTADKFMVCQTFTSPDLDGWACGDVAPANVVDLEPFGPAPRTSADLVAVCRQPQRARAELMHIWFDGAAFRAVEMFALPITTQYVEVGDVTGDGVDDILAFDNAAPIPLLHVYPQCTSRERGDCSKLDGEK